MIVDTYYSFTSLQKRQFCIGPKDPDNPEGTGTNAQNGIVTNFDII